jgi:hypothetical protein
MLYPFFCLLLKDVNPYILTYLSLLDEATKETDTFTYPLLGIFSDARINGNLSLMIINLKQNGHLNGTRLCICTYFVGLNNSRLVTS